VTVAPDPSLLESRLRELVPVDQPLLLITQAQRSGGTLLLRLLDGHPECHVIPFQLRGIDDAAKRLAAKPEEAWRALYDPKLAERFEQGHRQVKHDVLDHDEVFPFELPPELQRAIFDACAARIAEPSPRELLDCYFTSYFNAWLDNRNLQTGTKRWVVGFEPGVTRSMRRRAAVRELYPDGRIVSIVRDPWSWFASARRWEPRWRDRERALDHWCLTGGGAIKWRQTAKPDLRFIAFDDLLADPEAEMRRLAAWLEIEFRPELLQPTFNGQPIRANTSFADVTTGISTRPLERAKEELDPEDVAYIQERAGKLYSRLAHKVEKDWA
jgi:Sulfotransferase family